MIRNTRKAVLSTLVILVFFYALGCKNPADPLENGEDTNQVVKSDYVVDLSTGTNIWGSTGTTNINEDGSVTIEFADSQYQAWAINLYTDGIAGRNFTGYDSIVLVTSIVNSSDEFSFALLCGGFDSENNTALKQFKDNPDTGQKTYFISLTGLDDEDLSDVQQIVFQNSVAGMSLLIHSITFKPAQTSPDSEYALDLSTGVNIWGSATNISINEDESVTLVFENGQYKAWAIDPLKTNYVGYTTLEVTATTGSVEEGIPDEFKVMTLGTDHSYDEDGLDVWLGSAAAGKHTYQIDLTLADNWGVAENFAAELANIGRVIIQNNQANMVLTIHSIIFK